MTALKGYGVPGPELTDRIQALVGPSAPLIHLQARSFELLGVLAADTNP